MTDIRLRAPSRLHFGLLSWGKDRPRQFGGVGLMIERPGLELWCRPAPTWSAEGPLGDRALGVAWKVAACLQAEGPIPPPLHFTIERAPPEHVGLGVGTQLSLAVARCVALSADLPDVDVSRLAAWSGRGRRSGVGIHGFAQGGLIVDGGHRSDRPESKAPPLLCRHEFPEDWSVLVITPPLPAGISGTDEQRAFADLPRFRDELVDRLCRLVLLELVPAVVESDLASFGAALEEVQARVGEAFSPTQGGTYAHPRHADLVTWMRREGLVGVGQSSWGPTVYGFLDAGAETPAMKSLVDRIASRFELQVSQVFWTRPDNRGATWTRP